MFQIYDQEKPAICPRVSGQSGWLATGQSCDYRGRAGRSRHQSSPGQLTGLTCWDVARSLAGVTGDAISPREFHIGELSDGFLLLSLSLQVLRIAILLSVTKCTGRRGMLRPHVSFPTREGGAINERVLVSIPATIGKKNHFYKKCKILSDKLLF